MGESSPATTATIASSMRGEPSGDETPRRISAKPSSSPARASRSSIAEAATAAIRAASEATAPAARQSRRSRRSAQGRPAAAEPVLDAAPGARLERAAGRAPASPSRAWRRAGISGEGRARTRSAPRPARAGLARARGGRASGRRADLVVAAEHVGAGRQQLEVSGGRGRPAASTRSGALGRRATHGGHRPRALAGVRRSRGPRRSCSRIDRIPVEAARLQRQLRLAGGPAAVDRQRHGPVTSDAAGESRKAIAPATSRGWPTRPRGMRRTAARVHGVDLEHGRGHRRPDEGRADGVDADAVAGPVDGQAAVERGDGALRRRVGGLARQRHQRRLGRHSTMLPAPAGIIERCARPPPSGTSPSR